MKNLQFILKLKLKPEAMKKMPLAFVLFFVLSLFSFTACSPGYGCFYTASEKMPDQLESSTTDLEVNRSNIHSEEVNCLP